MSEKHFEFGLAHVSKKNLALGYVAFIGIAALVLTTILFVHYSQPTTVIVEPNDPVLDEPSEEPKPEKTKKPKPSCYDKPNKKGCDMTEINESFIAAFDPKPKDFCRYPLNYIVLVDGGMQKKDWKLGEWAIQNCQLLGVGDNVGAIKSWMAIGGYIFGQKAQANV